jgi:hypothetical protein
MLPCLAVPFVGADGRERSEGDIVSMDTHGLERAARAVTLAALVLLVTAAPAAAAKRAFNFTPRAPKAGETIRLTASAKLCGHHRKCRYMWERSRRQHGAKRTRIAKGRRARVVFKSAGAVWVRLTVRRSGAKTLRAWRRLKVATRPATAPVAGAVPATPAASSPAVAQAAWAVPGPPPIVCTTGATPATFASQFAALQPGQTLCLGPGDYGTWNGGAKPGPVTVAGAPGAAVSMRLDFSGASNLNVQNMTIAGGRIGGSSRNVSVAGSNFTGLFLIETSSPNAGIVLNGNRHVNLDAPASGLPARVTVWASATPSGVTVANSLFQGGDADGVRPDGDSVQVIGNEFADIVDKGANHADPIQLYGGTRAVIRGNFFHNVSGKITAYIMQADGGTGNVIEDNVFAAGKGVGYGITLMSDSGTVIRHNTFQPGTCDFNIRCGTLSLGNKSGDPVSRGTVIQDNILASIGGGQGTYTSSHNMYTSTSAGGAGDFRGTPTFAGPLTQWAGFRLVAGSLGATAASDGAAVGIR